MNTFGRLFRLTTFGESHGPAIGGVIDGCPAGVEINLEEIQAALDRRRPGQSKITTQRKEKDQVQLLSGVFEGKTTGTPIGFLIQNEDAKSRDYDHIKNVYRPSHADFTMDAKFGFRDYRGGGRTSARETACRVVAGAIAAIFLKEKGIQTRAWVERVKDIFAVIQDFPSQQEVEASIVRCPDPKKAEQMEALIDVTRKAGDTVGGSIRCMVKGVPAGIGAPVFDKLHAVLGHAMFSINAVKGVEFGSGIAGTHEYGSLQNDSFTSKDSSISTKSNNSGGIQGGISNGEIISFATHFKPVATLIQDQASVDSDGNEVIVKGKGRHDPCVLPRAVPIVEAMTAIVIMDAFLGHRLDRQ